MAINLVTWNASLVTPQDDALVYEVAVGQSGIIYGAEVTIKNSNTLHITSGHGIACGRKFTITEEDIALELSPSGTMQGRLYVHMDLSNTSTPIELLTERAQTLTPPIQDTDVNITLGVYEFNLATFTVSETAISGLQNVAPAVIETAQKAIDAEEAINNLNDIVMETEETINKLNNIVMKTLTVAGWQLSGSQYVQTIAFTKIHSMKPIISACGSTLGTLASKIQYKALASLRVLGDTEANTFTFYADAAPIVDINLSIKGVE